MFFLSPEFPMLDSQNSSYDARIMPNYAQSCRLISQRRAYFACPRWRRCGVTRRAPSACSAQCWLPRLACRAAEAAAAAEEEEAAEAEAAAAVPYTTRSSIFIRA